MQTNTTITSESATDKTGKSPTVTPESQRSTSRFPEATPVRPDVWERRLNRWLLRNLSFFVRSEESRVFVLTIAVGGACGLVAVSFHLAIRAVEKLLIDRAIAAQGWTWMVWTVVTPVLGGVAAGLLLQYVVPAARGSGIPQVKQLYSSGSGRVRLRDGVGKFVIGALQIGSGASLGREGPTVQICAAVASFLGRVFALSPSNQRRLIPVGAAAGIAAAFNAPIAAVTFVVEELVGGLDTTVLSGVVVAAALAAVVEHGVLGGTPVFDVPGSYSLQSASSLLLYVILGVAAGLIGTLFVKSLLGLRTTFRRMTRIPKWAQPAIGGLVTGILAVVVLATIHTTGITGGGYNTLGQALRGNLAFRVLVVLCGAKLVATVFSYSSGGAGGIFAPSLFIGGMLGGAIGQLDESILHHPTSDAGAFALVGMGAVFAAVVRAPMTSILIIFEMTGSYGLVLPLMISNMVAYLIARKWQKLPIYEALLAQDGIHLPHGKQTQPLLRSLTVASAMTADPIVIDGSWSIADTFQRIESLPFAAYPVIDGAGLILGVLTEGRIRRIVAEEDASTTAASQARTREYLRVEQSLREALAAMHRLGVRQMAVLDNSQVGRVVGVLTMSDVTRAALKAEQAVTETPAPV